MTNPPGKKPILLGVMCAGMALVPILLSAVPPLLDYPSHIARIYIIHDLLFRGQFGEMYALHPAILPNLGMDIVLLGAMMLGIDIEIAGRILLAVLVLGLGVSVMLLHRRLLGRWSVCPLLAFAFIYNKILMLGFINYLMGICIALLGFAFWLGARERAASIRSVLGLMAWSLAAFVCHLMAVLLLLGLIVAHEGTLCTYEVVRRGIRPAVRKAYHSAILMFPSVALTVGLYLATPFASRPRDRDVNWGLPDVALWFRHRVNAVLHAGDSYDPMLDIIVVVGLALLLVGSLMAGYLRIAWSMLPALAAILIFNFITPYHWAGTSFIADRIPILLVLVGISSIDIVPPARRSALGLLTFLVLFLVGARSVSASLAWHDADRSYAAMRVALDKLPEDARIYGATIYHDSFQSTLRQPWAHFPSLGVLRKRVRAIGVFAEPSQNILVRAPALEALAALQPFVLRVDLLTGKPDFNIDIFAPERLAQFDYALVANPGLYPGGVPANLVPLWSAGDATLFAIPHGGRRLDFSAP